MQRQLILVIGLLLSSCVPAGAQTLATPLLLAQARPAPTTILVSALPTPFLPNAPLASERPRKPVAPATVFLVPAYEPDYSLESRPLIPTIRTPFLTESRLVVAQFWRGHLQLNGVPHLIERILSGPPWTFLLQFAGQPSQTQIPTRRSRVHARLRRRNLLILLCIRQLSEPPHLLVSDHLVALSERDSRWSH